MNNRLVGHSASMHNTSGSPRDRTPISGIAHIYSSDRKHGNLARVPIPFFVIWCVPNRTPRLNTSLQSENW